MPSSVNITSPANGASVNANFTVSIDYSNGETATAYLLLKCDHTGAHTHQVLIVPSGGSGTTNYQLTHTAGFSGVSLEARLQHTQTWGDSYLAHSIKSNIAVSAPPVPGDG